MTTGPRPRVPAVMFASLALAACGTTTIDPKSGEDIIRTAVGGRGVAAVRTVSCPADVKPSDGNTMTCKVVLTIGGRQHAGTIRLHVVSGGKKLALNPLTDVAVK